MTEIEVIIEVEVIITINIDLIVIEINTITNALDKEDDSYFHIL